MHKILIILAFGFFLLVSCGQTTSNKPTATPKIKAPDFTLKDLAGFERKLSNLISNKPLVVDFWASWCPYCVEELPELLKIHNKGEGKFNLVAISLDKSAFAALSFTKGRKLNLNSLFDADGKVAKLYGVTSIPTIMIINSQGEIINREATLKDVEALTK